MTSESNDDEERKKTLRIHQYFQKHKSRIGLLVGAALITTVFYIPPHYTEVSCNDQSIRRPYYPDTISVRVLLIAALALPFTMITVLEWVYPPAGISEKDTPLRQSFRRSWRYVGDLFIGGLLMFFFNDLAKIATSEARPSFWSLCSPSITEEQCLQPYVRISWKDCANPLNFSERKLADSMKSFPSGHSSVSVYSSVFMIAYIQQRVWSNSNRLLVPSLQIMWAVWALICCQSRIWDNKHHWWDVLAGAFLGAFGSFISVKYFSNWFMREEPSEKPGITKRQDYLLQQDEAT